mmetsp:Transcript_25779/g.66367  ORF Transcript_25779/g.66367 Transcript_25779/m.66367 type:complete len:283 (+) Transcript_25779:515-1363(+)
MKFKAVFSDHGLRALEKGFVPTLDKFGKTCQLLLGPQDVYFIQTGVNTDGVHVTARLSRDTLFEEEGFLISSRTNDNIAFSFEVANLLRVLRGSSANGADLLEIKLAMRSVAVGGAAATASKPFLTFTSRGESLNIVSDMPISPPYKALEIERLTQELSRTEALSAFYVDIQPEVARLQAVLEKLKSLGDTVLLAITKGGDMHIQVQESVVELGMELRGLPVLPQDEAENAQPLEGTTAEARLREIQSAQDAGVVVRSVVPPHASTHSLRPASTRPARHSAG